MKKTLILLLLAGLLNTAFAQTSNNITLLSQWHDPTLPVTDFNLRYSGCWGISVNNHEIAVIGGAKHVMFFDITDPSTPELIGKFEGQKNTVWREFKSYKNRIYATSDATQEGLMIFDMNNAPDTIVRTYYSNEFFNSAHTHMLDTVSGRIYLNGSNVADMVVLDISQNPDQPQLLAAVQLDGDYIHDSYVRNDTLYASSGNNGLWIYDMQQPTLPVTLAHVSTGGYNHNNWVTTDGKYCYYTEEIPDGRPIRIVSLDGLASGDLEVVGGFLDELLPDPPGYSAISHNVYIKDTLLFDSQYEDGLLVYDISEPVTPVLLGYYDTSPNNTIYNLYAGCWGNYPWLPSGNIIASDMQNGLFVLRMTTPSSIQESEITRKARIFPNPAGANCQIAFPGVMNNWAYRLFDLRGQLLMEQHFTHSAGARVDTEVLTTGMYMLEIETENAVRQVIKLLVQ